MGRSPLATKRREYESLETKPATKFWGVRRKQEISLAASVWSRRCDELGVELS